MGVTINANVRIHIHMEDPALLRDMMNLILKTTEGLSADIKKAEQTLKELKEQSDK
jgi:hypothetical protein